MEGVQQFHDFSFVLPNANENNISAKYLAK
jgi:hypothetical protein